MVAVLIGLPGAYAGHVALTAHRAAPLVTELADLGSSSVGPAAVDAAGRDFFDGDPVDGTPLYWPFVVFGGAFLSLVVLAGGAIGVMLGGRIRTVGVVAAMAALILLWAPPIYHHRTIDVVSHYVG